MRFLFIVYDNGSHIHLYPLGIGYLAAVLRAAGHYVHVLHRDIHHHSKAFVTRHIEMNDYDFVGIGLIAGYWQHAQLLELSGAINAAENRRTFQFLLGGHGPSPEPEYFIRVSGADAVVVGEAEETIIALANDPDSKDIAGVYRPGCPFRRRETIKDLSTLPWPSYSTFPVDYYRLLRMPHAEPGDFVMPMLSGRGCPYNCTFCYRMDPGFRPRDSRDIIDEVTHLQRVHKITYISFCDELLMSSKHRMDEFCERVLCTGMKFKWSCNGRLNHAEPNVVSKMKRAGCVFINYGIEAIDDYVLEKMNKHLTVDQIIAGVEATIQAGISPGLNVIWGNVGDSPVTLNRAVRFLKKYADTSQLRTIRPVTPYPGTVLYELAKSHGKIKDCEDFYLKHINSDLFTCQFTELSDDDACACLALANDSLIHRHYTQVAHNMSEAAYTLYEKKDHTFRGFRQT